MNKPNSIVWLSGEAAVVTGGVNTREWCATGVSLNAAEIKPGDLYIATSDDDLAHVFQKGAAAAVVAGNVSVSGDYPLLKVGSVFEALQSLAAAGRYKTHGVVVSVPSCKQRRIVHDLLVKVASVHEGARHHAVGLAGIPEDIDYGLFGSSPAAHPDIAVISDCASTNSDALFESMPAHGIAIIHAGSEGALSVITQARAAGVQNIFTYGEQAHADARISRRLQGDDRVSLNVSILGEEISLSLPIEVGADSGIAATLLLLKLSGHKLSRVVRMLELPSASLQNEPQAVFRVKSMIDLGFGRQTAVLDGLAHSVHKALGWPKKDLEIPARFDKIDFVYTSRRFSAVPSAHAAIKARYRNARVEAIGAEAMAPGDFVVFRDNRQQKSAVFSEALRLVKPKGLKHAL